jgi:hypothetical protein
MSWFAPVSYGQPYGKPLWSLKLHRVRSCTLAGRRRCWATTSVAPAQIGFVRARPRRGGRGCGAVAAERTDRPVAAAGGAAFVTVQDVETRRRARERLHFERAGRCGQGLLDVGDDGGAREAHALDVAGGFRCRARPGDDGRRVAAAGDLLRQAFDLAAPFGHARSAAQAMAARIAARPSATGRGFRTGAAARVAAVGGYPAHARDAHSAASPGINIVPGRKSCPCGQVNAAQVAFRSVL